MTIPSPLGTRPPIPGARPLNSVPPLGARPMPPMGTRPMPGARPLPSFSPKPSSGLKNPEQATLALIIIAVGVVLLIVAIAMM